TADVASLLAFYRSDRHRVLRSFPTRRSSDLLASSAPSGWMAITRITWVCPRRISSACRVATSQMRIVRSALPLSKCAPSGLKTRSEEHTSELQSRENLVCRLLLEKKNQITAP